MSGEPCFAGTSERPEVRFTLIGFVASAEFQLCLAIIEFLHRKQSHQFPAPFIRPMLEFDWVEYQLKAKRKYGGKLWSIDKPFIIYANDDLLGSAEELQTYLAQWFLVKLNRDFDCLALRGVADMYEKYMELGRRFVYLSLSLNDKYVGSVIIMLYYDILPKTCKNFLRKCNSKRRGYRGTRLHRIMEKSWIQCADFNLPVGSMSNENYVVPHNRRGIVSMCSNGPHIANITQFFITLDATPWMDYRYVAFGQIMQGEYVLRALEYLPTTFEAPDDQIVISDCGELSLEDTGMAKHIPRIEEYLKERDANETTNETDVLDLRDVASVLLEENYRALKYSYFNDDKSHLPLDNVESRLFTIPSMCSTSQALLALAEDEGEEGVHRLPWKDSQTYIKDLLFHLPELIYLRQMGASESQNLMAESYAIQQYVDDLNATELWESVEKSVVFDFEEDVEDVEDEERSYSRTLSGEFGKSGRVKSKVMFVEPVKEPSSDEGGEGAEEEQQEEVEPVEPVEPALPQPDLEEVQEAEPPEPETPLEAQPYEESEAEQEG